MTLKNKKIGALCDAIYSGGTPSTAHKEYWDGTFYWLSSGETNNRFIHKTNSLITEEGIKNSSTRLARSGDIVIASAGQGKTRGQTSLLMNDMYVNQSVIVLHPKKELLNYLYLFYNLTLRYDELRILSDSSSTRGSITTEMLKKLSITLFDIEIQEKIGALLSSYDQLIENNTRRISLLEKMAQELYKEWFVRFRFPGHEHVKIVNGVPEGWVIEPMHDMVDVTDGTHDTPTPTEEGVPLVTGRAIENGFIDFSSTYNISINDHESIKKRSGLKTGDILFSNIGTVGNCCIVDYDREFSVKNLIIFKSMSLALTAYIYCWLKSNSIQEIMQLVANGTSQHFIGLTFMRNFKIVNPNTTILNKFGELISPFFVKIRILRKEIANLIKQRDLLLPRLMSGKLELS